MTVPEVDPRDLAVELASESPPRLLDVREPFEHDFSSLEHSIDVPMDELVARLPSLGRDDNWVVLCRSGHRSAHVTQYLLQSGFSRVRNLAGGLNAWVAAVDPSMRIY
jgi:rhodanese-related sulfurtransferase